MCICASVGHTVFERLSVPKIGAPTSARTDCGLREDAESTTPAKPHERGTVVAIEGSAAQCVVGVDLTSDERAGSSRWRPSP